MRNLCMVLAVLLIASIIWIASVFRADPQTPQEPPPEQSTQLRKQGNQELAYLLVKLELRTRGVIGKHYTRPQSSVPGVNLVYKRWLAKNAILPAAVADRIFSNVVPQATGGRAWVKMVVDDPRNPNNRADSIAEKLLGNIKRGEAEAERTTPEAYYYAEPIKATETCLPCHGEPRGEPDPAFPQYKKNGWRAGEVIGAVIARVADHG